MTENDGVICMGPGICIIYYTVHILMDAHWHGLRRWAMASLSAQ